MNPKYPLYIPSKGRADSRLTVKTLEHMGVPFRIVVEPQEYDEYASVIDPAKILILDMDYKKQYEMCDELGLTKTSGSGPARNFIWDHAVSTGAEFHWIMDDNIRNFYRRNHNAKIRVHDGAFFRAMEEFVERYENIAMAGPQYHYLGLQQRALTTPFSINSRIYSCNLIRNDVPFRWRGRYNEDTILSLDMLKAGWCTVTFNAFLQGKMTTTAKMKGGNTDELYREGTLAKSQMMMTTHPDVSRVVWRYNRWHHHVDYRRFKRNQLKLKPGIDLSTMEPNEYGMKLVNVHTREPIPTPALHKAAD